MPNLDRVGGGVYYTTWGYRDVAAEKHPNLETQKARRVLRLRRARSKAKSRRRGPSDQGCEYQAAAPDRGSDPRAGAHGGRGALLHRHSDPDLLRAGGSTRCGKGVDEQPSPAL